MEKKTKTVQVVESVTLTRDEYVAAAKSVIRDMIDKRLVKDSIMPPALIIDAIRTTGADFFANLEAELFGVYVENKEEK